MQATVLPESIEAVHGAYKIVTLSSFGVIWQHKEGGGTGTFHNCITS